MILEKRIAISFWIGVGILGLTFIAVIGGYN
jgi:hypothetical protein